MTLPLHETGKISSVNPWIEKKLTFLIGFFRYVMRPNPTATLEERTLLPVIPAEAGIQCFVGLNSPSKKMKNLVGPDRQV